MKHRRHFGQWTRRRFGYPVSACGVLPEFYPTVTPLGTATILVVYLPMPCSRGPTDAVTVKSLTTVYVALLDEGVDVWRPVKAESLGKGRYRLVGPVPETEIWQFSPDSIVRCESRQFEDGHSGLVAIEQL